MSAPTDLVTRVRSRLASGGLEITSAEVACAVLVEAGVAVGDADILVTARGSVVVRSGVVS